MLSKLYNLYNNCVKNTSKTKTRRFFYNLYTHFFYYFCNYVLVFYYKMTKRLNKLKPNNNNPQIIISLTSYPKRINTIWITIESLIRQKQQPDMIILWLAEDQFPNKILPKSLTNQQKRGLTIRWCENLMSHKKYFYVCQEYPNSNIITADDDSIYPPFFVNRLWEMHLKYPKDVVSLTSQTIYPSYRTPPSQWIGISRQEIISSYKISLNSGSGALFPPKSLHKEAFNKEQIKKLCPYADDLWLTIMTHMNGTMISKYTFNPFPIVIKSTQDESLCRNFNTTTNTINNDTQWAAITNEYSHKLKKIIGDFF